MPNSAAMELFDYWAKCPPVHLMVKEYLGYEGPIEQRGPVNPVEVAAAMRATGFVGRAAKVATAPARDREIFSQMREQAKKKAA